MKRLHIIALIIGSLSLNICKAQSNDFTLGVILPDASADFNGAQVQKLGAKITQLINASGEAIVDFSNDFIVYPVISVEEINVVEGGMQNLTVSTIDFSLYVKQLSTKMVYNTISKKLKGSGTDKTQAVTNAISQIKVADESYKQFISTAKMKIIKYYNDNCKLILQKADNLAAGHDYEQAIAILQSIPSASAACYSEGGKKSLVLYKKYQSVLCTKNINKARAEIAVNNYNDALDALMMIDPSSDCGPEVKKLIGQISAKTDKQAKQELDLEKARINAIKEIGKAYYSNTTRLVSYNVILH